MQQEPVKSRKSLGLGIDTGGTYTDAAIVDMATRRVLAKAKAQTTYHDLSQGLLKAVDEVLASGVDVGQIELVGISTTLATNSLLQGKGGRVGLIGIGWHPDGDWHLGAARSAFIDGGHDARGRTLAPLDPGQVDAAIATVMDGVESIVVSGFFSIVNPVHEDAVRERVRELTGLPVVAGRELTSELGIRERTVTAVLNARLLPILSEFIDGVERSMRSRNVTANIMVFRGNGTLMSLAKAREHPVETILSGPAASLMGGQALSGVDNCIVVDVGGTSTDIAFLDAGFPRLKAEGATVGEWRTRVRAIDIWTAGLGGDSRLSAESGALTIGPDRVLPLEEACIQNPSLLKKIVDHERTEFLVAIPRDPSGLPEGERLVFETIRDKGPLAASEVHQLLPNVYLASHYIKRLTEKTHLISTGLTPTDVLHVTGAYRRGSVEASRAGVELLAKELDCTTEQAVELILKRMGERIAEEVSKKAFLDGSGEMLRGRLGTYVLDAITGAHPDQGFHLAATLDRPIVAIGAPAHVYVPMVEKMLGTNVVVPENHEVGNAVGAVCSIVAESVMVEIHSRDERLHVYAPGREPVDFEHEEEAIAHAKNVAEEIARKRAEDAGGVGIAVKVDVKEVRFRLGAKEVQEYVNWVEVHARASGKPGAVGGGTKA